MDPVARQDLLVRTTRLSAGILVAVAALTLQGRAQDAAASDDVPKSTAAPGAADSGPPTDESPAPQAAPPPVAPPVPAAPARAAAPQNPQAVYLLEGIRNARRKLRSAICDLQFSHGYEDQLKPELSESEQNTVLIAFSEGGDFRMSWTFPLKTAEARFLRSTADIPMDSPERTGHFVRTRERTIQWFEGQPTVDILPVDAPYPSWIKFFDVRALGVYSWIELQQGLTLDQQIDSFLQNPVKEIRENSEHVFTLTWNLGSDNSQWILDVDSVKGFTPVSAQMRQRDGDNDPWRIVQEFHTDWKEIASVWVPIRFQGRNSQKPEVSSRTVSMELDWRNVNGAVPRELFALESFNAPDAVGVVDSTLGSPIEIKVPGQPFAKDQQPEPRAGWSSRWFVAVNAAVFAAIVLILLYQRRRSARL